MRFKLYHSKKLKLGLSRFRAKFAWLPISIDIHHGHKEFYSTETYEYIWLQRYVIYEQVGLKNNEYCWKFSQISYLCDPSIVDSLTEMANSKDNADINLAFEIFKGKRKI